ncbi:retrovirus-related pol polyprotein from transposon TNT 1-94 [Tanacetum coccineum]
MKAKLALLEASPSTSQSPKPFQSKNKGLVVKTFNWDVEEVSDDEEMKQVKVLMALVDDELDVWKNHARNDEWIDITIRKCRDDLLIFKQAKLDAVTFQIQNTELAKLNHALQEQLKEERKDNEKWLNCSDKVSQCISEQIPNQKKKILGGEQLTKSSSKNDVKENPFIPASLDYDHEMVPNFKDWVERHNPDSKLSNFNTRRIIVHESQAVNECLKLTEAPIDPESSKESGSEPLTPLPLLKKSLGSFSKLRVRGEVLAESSQSSESSINVCCTTFGSNVHSTTDHNDFEHFKRGDKIQATKAREPTKRIKHVHHVKKESIRELHSKQKNFSIRKCLHLLHMDLTGPVSSMSINNEKYTSVIVDEYSRYTWVHFLRKKSQAAEMIMSFIRMNFSSLYTPEQNGVAEKKNKTLIEAARTMLNGLVLSKHFWTEADHLGKFDAKVDDGYFLGYLFVSKAFRDFNTRRQQIEETYHVTFDESIKAIKFINTSVDEIGIDDSSRYPPDEFHHEDDPL